MRLLAELYRDRRGGIALTTAFALTGLIGFVALAVDVGIWYGQKAKLQSATDAAAYAGVQELSRANATDDAVLAVVRQMAADNGFNAAAGAQVEAAVVNSRTAVEVSIREAGPILFSSVVKSAAPNMVARARAGMIGQNPPCILALDPSAAGAVDLTGSPSLNGPSCKVQVNSVSPDAMRLTGAAHVRAGEICIAGGASGRTGNISPAPDTGCAPMPDPLAGVPTTPTPGCDEPGAFVATAASPLEPSRIYCGRVTLGGDLVLAPGLYIFKDGGLDVGNHSLRGEGVTLYFTGTATFSAGGNGEMYLKAPTTGTYAGIVIYQDRNAPVGGLSEISGNANKHYEGTVYMPNGDIEFRGAGSGNTSSPYSIFIARRFSFVGSGDLKIGTDYGSSVVKPPAGLGRRLTLTQ